MRYLFTYQRKLFAFKVASDIGSNWLSVQIELPWSPQTITKSVSEEEGRMVIGDSKEESAAMFNELSDYILGNDTSMVTNTMMRMVRDGVVSSLQVIQRWMVKRFPLAYCFAASMNDAMKLPGPFMRGARPYDVRSNKEVQYFCFVYLAPSATDLAVAKATLRISPKENMRRLGTCGFLGLAASSV